MFRHLLPSLVLFSLLCSPAARAADPIPPIPRVLPPVGLEIPADVRTRLEQRLAETKTRLEKFKAECDALADRELIEGLALGKPSPRSKLWRYPNDVEVFVKAVEFAILHREFYVPKDFEKADWALDQANQRLDAIAKDEAPWTRATGLVVKGYRSKVDASIQPYGVVIPPDHDFSKPCRVYVWLHGRGDKNTDLHFLYERATRPGQISPPPGSIVLHPFGRQCVGWKHAAEHDIQMAWFNLCQSYNVDDERTVLIGFSMGGAGAWHYGAHFASQFLAVSPGAGFAETARYQRLTPDKYPPWYEQKLWTLYDVPNYTRNLFNTEVIAYSGERDRQIQAARVMEEAFQAEGRQLTHLIGPGVEHQYEKKTLAELMRRLDAGAVKGRSEPAQTVHLQTRTLAYSQQAWVRATGLDEHWLDSRVDAEIIHPKLIRVKTRNIRRLELSPLPEMRGVVIDIDGSRVEIISERSRPIEAHVATASEPGPQIFSTAYLVKQDAGWVEEAEPDNRLAKGPGLQGPIDDAFNSEFLVVVPTGPFPNDAFRNWVEFEQQHFLDRWRALMRGEPRVKKDTEVNDRDLTDFNVILWGDARSNRVIAKFSSWLGVRYGDGVWRIGDQEFDASKYVPVMIRPSPGSSDHYLVLNSGLTFREGHDRTNSLQNPKLPDWAIVDLTQPPDAFAPGRIHDAGFFDEQWQLKSQPKAP